MDLKTIITVLFSGLVAALVTYWLNRRAAKLDAKTRYEFEHKLTEDRQRIAEEWEKRRYEANKRLLFFRSFSELFYSYRNELFYFALDMQNTEALYAGAERQAEQVIRSQNPNVTAAQLESGKVLLTQQVSLDCNSRKVARMDKFNFDVKALAARADTEVSVASHYLPRELHSKIQILLKKIDTRVGTAAEAIQELRNFETYEIEFKNIQKNLLDNFDAVVAKASTAASGK